MTDTYRTGNNARKLQNNAYFIKNENKMREQVKVDRKLNIRYRAKQMVERGLKN